MDPNVLEPGHAPTPFTAAEIRDGCPAGRTIRLLVEPAGGPSVVRVTRYLEADAAGVVQERSRTTPAGDPIGSPDRERSTWAELQAHASFPDEMTTIEDDVIDLPVGQLDCRRYTVVDGATVTRFWFARARPGMPVRVVAEEMGTVVSTVTMISDEVVG